MTRPSPMISPFGEQRSCFRVGYGAGASAFARMGFRSAFGAHAGALVLPV